MKSDDVIVEGMNDDILEVGRQSTQQLYYIRAKTDWNTTIVGLSRDSALVIVNTLLTYLEEDV